MEHRMLGHTGIKLPMLGFGCAPNANLMTDDDERLREETIRLAINSDIDYFDTSEKYGDGHSEANLGRILQTIQARPQISTKVYVRASDLSDPRSGILRSVEASLRRLNVDRVSVLLLHNRVFVNPPDGDIFGTAPLSLRHIFGKNGVAAAFEELRAEGTITAAGLTTLGGDKTALTDMISSSVFGVINASISVANPSGLVRSNSKFDPDWRGVITEAAKAGLGILAVQVLAGGLLTREALGATTRGATEEFGPSGHLPRRRRDAVASALHQVATDLDASIVEVAIRYVLSQPEITSAIIGFSNPSHVQQAVAAARKSVLSAEHIAILEGAHFT